MCHLNGTARSSFVDANGSVLPAVSSAWMQGSEVNNSMQRTAVQLSS